MRHTFPICCARAASGHATAPPMSAIHSRRLVSSIGFPPPCRVLPLTQSVCRMLSLPQGGPKVLGLDLNHSESRRGAARPLLYCRPNDSTRGGSPLCCGISVPPSSALGHLRPRQSELDRAACPLCPETGQVHHRKTSAECPRNRVMLSLRFGPSCIRTA